MTQTTATLLARALHNNRLTQGEAAALLEISRPSLSRILNGKQIPRAALQTKIESLWGIPASTWPHPFRAPRIAPARAPRRPSATRGEEKAAA